MKTTAPIVIRNIDVIQDQWCREGRYRRELSPEAKRALAGSPWEGASWSVMVTAARRVWEALDDDLSDLVENTRGTTPTPVLHQTLNGLPKDGATYQVAVIVWAATGPVTSGDIRAELRKGGIQMYDYNINRALRGLERRGFIVEMGSRKTPGGPPAMQWWLNPKIRGAHQ